MNIKRKLTIGLLVFFVGVLMTACGSDSSSSPAATDKTGTTTTPTTTVPTPTTTGTATCATNCGQQYQVTLNVVNKEAFALLVGIDNVNNSAPLNVFDNSTFFGVLGNSLGNTFVNCANGIFGAWLASLTGANAEGGCSGSTTTTTSTGGTTVPYSNVANSYNMVIVPQTGNVYEGSINGSGFNHGFRAVYNSNSGIYEGTNTASQYPLGLRIQNNIMELVTYINGSIVIVGTIN